MRYSRRYWDETPGGNRTDWGESWWYFETDDSGNVTRQIERYYGGRILRYDSLHVEDDFGFLSKVPLDLDEYKSFEISKEDFDEAWVFEVGPHRRAFADFLDQLAGGDCDQQQWSSFIVTHYFDKTLEDIRRQVAREGHDYSTHQLRVWAQTLRSSD